MAAREAPYGADPNALANTVRGALHIGASQARAKRLGNVLGRIGHGKTVIANFAKLIAERLSRVERELLAALEKIEPETRREKLAGRPGPD